MTLRDLPSTDALASRLGDDFDLPMPIVVAICRAEIDATRETISAGGTGDPEASARLRLGDIAAARPVAVINATGVLLHTNLGRAPMHTDAADIARELAVRPANVEIDLRTGRRAKRHDYLSPLLTALTGAEAGIAVNNAAGALMVAIASIAGPGRRVAVSRGELIEIGGSFRLPELMAASGAELVEVGTTNRTRGSDFEAVASTVDAILAVHPSNYRMEGFTEGVAPGDLARLAHHHGIPFIHDVGSGLLDSTAPWLGDQPREWLSHEPGVRQAVEGGADLVLFSGDKLLGGPQAGILVGTKVAVEAVDRHPVARAVRLDGPTIGALVATLELYARHQVLSIPFWRMVGSTLESITDRAERVAAGIASARLVPGESVPGAGSVPGGTIPTTLIRIDGSADEMWRTLVGAPVPVVATRREGAVLIDLRSVLPEDDDLVRSALMAATG
ncbi:MAG TPA: L-seryl-tRNA(Sec) selenium transferase [Acidimicrobiia bacterium]|nr:L-seryl-tRNA(Sec) selenium transferase [Acidimicrobiia bacterium]